MDYAQCPSTENQIRSAELSLRRGESEAWIARQLVERTGRQPCDAFLIVRAAQILRRHRPRLHWMRRP